jgi:hypothetical protein
MISEKPIPNINTENIHLIHHIIQFVLQIFGIGLNIRAVIE